MSSWLSDFFRFWWSLFYWNIRKSLFVLRGRRTRCPCQNPSDSGKGGETGCDASLSWNKPARFRRVCPLLKHGEMGWRCSVSAEEVRPFWSRAFLACGVLGITSYTIAALSLFLVLRGVGYEEIRFRHVFWPGDWAERSVVQARHYHDRGAAALSEGNLRQAALSFSTAYEMDPSNYEAGIRLAQIRRLTRQRAVSDHLFERLIRQHPDRAGETAYVWLLALLGDREYDKAAVLAARNLRDGVPNRPAWARALFFACRQTGDPGPIEVLLESPAMEDDWQTLLTIEAGLLGDDQLPALRKLAVIREDETDPFYLFYQVERLIEMREFAPADTALRFYQGRIGAVEEQKLKWELILRRGWDSLLSIELDGQTLSPKQLEFLTAALIRSPSQRVFQTIYTTHHPESRSDLSLGAGTILSLAAAAGAVGDEESQAELLHYVHDRFGLSSSVLNRLASLEAADRQNNALTHVLRTTHFPLEVFYALLERYG